MKLVYIDRKVGREWFPNIRVRQHLSFLNPPYVNMDGGEDPQTRGTLFEVHEVDIDAVVAVFATNNPGCEVKVYNLESIAVCPPGEIVKKQVTKEGVLPV